MTQLARSRRAVTGAVLLLVLAVGAFSAVRWQSAQAEAEDERWRHGGDAVEVSARIQLAGKADYPDVLQAAGAPRSRYAGPGSHAYVVQVRWNGTPEPGGQYAFLLLDGRMTPPKPISAVSTWYGGRSMGTHTHGYYYVLPEHYPWLAAIAPRRTGDAWSGDPYWAGAPASTAGEATLVFWPGKRDLRSRRPAHDLLLAMVLMDGEVQWARKVPLADGL